MTTSWNRQNIPAEMAYHDSDGNSVTHKIPESLGGLYIYCDGPVSAAGTNIGPFVLTWTCEFKGVRMDDNVVTLASLDMRPLRIDTSYQHLEDDQESSCTCHSVRHTFELA